MGGRLLSLNIRTRFTNSVKDSDKWQQTTKWFNTPILKKHSFLQMVKDISNHQMWNEVTTIGVMGREGTGKTTVSDVLAHYLHTELNGLISSTSISEELRTKLIRGYQVFRFGDTELLNFDSTLRKLPLVNRIIIFDDVSFLNGHANKKELDAMKKAFTTIRHMENIDLKTVVIFSYHYMRGFDKYLRDTHYRIITSVGDEEITNIQSLISSKKNKELVNSYKKLSTKFTSGGSIQFPVVSSKTRKTSRWVKYKYSSPFRLAIYYDGGDMRYIVYPRREMVIPNGCSICNRIVKTGNRKISSKLLFDFVKSQTDETSAAGAIRLFGFSIYGRPIQSEIGNRTKAFEIFRRIINSGIVRPDELVSELLPIIMNKDENYKMKYRTLRVSEETRKAFFTLFGIDALAADGVPSLQNNLENTESIISQPNH